MEPFIGQIQLFPYAFAPYGWMECDGRGLNTQTYTALYSLIGMAYGGGGTVFLLPDLRGCAPVGFGTTAYPIGQRGGAENVMMTGENSPPHSHSVNASSEPGTVNNPALAVLANALQSGTIEPAYLGLIYNPGTPPDKVFEAFGSSVAPAGGQQPHNNMQPSLVLRYCIAFDGIMPQPGA